MKRILKLGILSIFNALMLSIARCFDNDLWRISIVVFLYLFSFIIIYKTQKTKYGDEVKWILKW